MKNHENETQLILNRLGKEARLILKSAGIPAEEAIKEILEEEKWDLGTTRKENPIEIAELPIKDITLSELVWLCSLPNLEREASFREELHRRLSLLELTEEKKELLIALDLAALKEKDPQMREQAISPGRYIFADTTIENLPQPSSLLTTELVMIADDANAAWIRDHEWLPDPAIKATGFILGTAKSRGPYWKEFDRRVDLMGLEPWQIQSIIKNTCLIVGKAKWGYAPPEESWSEESLVRKDAKRGEF